MMKPEIKEKWVKALRSGEYKQGSSALRTVIHNDERFCCLGVLCDLYSIEHKKDEWSLKEGGGSYNHNGSGGYPSQKVLDWAGLYCSAGDFVTIGDDNETLASMNDLGYTFKEIATAIEEQL